MTTIKNSLHNKKLDFSNWGIELERRILMWTFGTYHFGYCNVEKSKGKKICSIIDIVKPNRA